MARDCDRMMTAKKEGWQNIIEGAVRVKRHLQPFHNPNNHAANHPATHRWRGR